jgi:hypothetical protein
MRKRFTLARVVRTTLLFLAATLLSQTGCENKPPPPPLYRILYDVPKPAPGKGQVKGQVLWVGDGKGIENVEVQLCEHAEVMMDFKCSGKSYNAKTDPEGVYWFRDVLPGSYSFAIKIPGSRGTYMVMTHGAALMFADSMRLEADQTIEVAPQKIHKADLKLIAPQAGETIREHKPALRWEAYPGATYYSVYFYDEKKHESVKLDTKDGLIKTTSVAPLDELPNGTYSLEVTAKDANFNKLAESEKMNFTIDDTKPTNNAKEKRPQ